MVQNPVHALHQWKKIKRDQSEEKRVFERETGGAIFLERAIVGLGGESWKPHPLSPSPVWGLQRDPSGSSLYFLQVGQWWPEEKGLAALAAEPGGVAALELSAPQSLPGPRMEPTSQYPDVGQQDDRASKESSRSCLKEPAAWVRRPHLRNLGGGPPGPGGGVQGTPWNGGVVGTPGERAHHGKPQRYTKAQRDRVL